MNVLDPFWLLFWVAVWALILLVCILLRCTWVDLSHVVLAQSHIAPEVLEHLFLQDFSGDSIRTAVERSITEEVAPLVNLSTKKYD